MDKRVNLTIDGRVVSVPEGMNLVDAAKTLGINIPVFCHHPKLKPAGMCRVCLVDVGRPQFDRTTGKPALNEDGSPRIVYGPKLETACTTLVSEGMVVWGATEKVMSARKEIIEFYLPLTRWIVRYVTKAGSVPYKIRAWSLVLRKAALYWMKNTGLKNICPWVN
jgi:NADH-quinone oxidoreductase subunit G